jgi:hypothetical protein
VVFLIKNRILFIVHLSGFITTAGAAAAAAAREKSENVNVLIFIFQKGPTRG